MSNTDSEREEISVTFLRQVWLPPANDLDRRLALHILSNQVIGGAGLTLEEWQTYDRLQRQLAQITLPVAVDAGTHLLWYCPELALWVLEYLGRQIAYLPFARLENIDYITILEAEVA